MTRLSVIPALASGEPYQPHWMHGEGAAWGEKNCYIDFWIELVHALGGDPHAMLAVTLPLDFEGDQWTFFKPSHDELYRLYGIGVQELNVWRPLLDHAVEHLAAGKLIAAESDAFWLPDTAGTDYRTNHVKTTIVITDLDVAARRLGYFHGPGFFWLEGDDFAGTFRLEVPPDPHFMPFFAEVMRLDRLVLRPGDELRALTAESIQAQLARRPSDNPIRRFGERVAHDMPKLREQGLAHYHAWAFATTRQLGAAFDLAARQAEWMARGAASEAEYRGAAAHFDLISSTCKALILKGARAVASGRPADLQTSFDAMSLAWDQGMAALATANFRTP